jgi:signal transduction histidine kinase/ligand-binding sensor domain-containing protein
MTWHPAAVRRCHFARAAALAAALAAGTAVDLLAAGITGYTSLSWTTRDGVFPGPFRAITQDSDGYIWLGISVDLVRFDGVRFVRWSELSDEPLRNGGVITSLCATRDRSLWIGHSPSGVTRLHDNVATDYTDKDGLPGGRVLGLVEDSNGDVWVGSRGGLARFEHGRWRRVGMSEGLPDEDTLLSLFLDKHGTMFVATSSGIFALSSGRRQFDRVATPPDGVRGLSEDLSGVLWITDSVKGYRRLDARTPSAPGSKPSPAIVGFRLMHDRADNLWVATQGQGLFRVRPDRESVEQMTKNDGLTSDVVLSLFEDRQRNVWVGTENGLVRLRETKGITKADIAASGGHEVTSTTDGSVWIGTTDGLYRFSRQGKQLYRTGDGLPDNEITALPIGPVDSLVVATARGIARFEDGRFLPVRFPQEPSTRSADAIAADRSGGLWVCDPERGLLRVAGERVMSHGQFSGVRDKPCLSLYADPDGRVFIGFKDGTAAKFEGDQFTEYTTKDGLPGGSVALISRDSHGVVWLSTTKGLAVFANDHFIRFAQDGLPAAGVSAALEDESGDMWFGFVSGIVRVARDDVAELLRTRASQIKYDVYDTSDGVGGQPLFRGFPGAARASDGRLWFVTTTGVSIVDPRQLPADRPPPPVRVESVTVNGRETEPALDASLPPLTSELRIDYTALSFASPQKTRFRYRLQGFDRDWVEVGARRQAIYTNLPPGRYRFSVLANDGGREWAATSSDWTFSIMPRFYQTTWFLFLCASAVVSAVWLAWRRRLRHVHLQFSLVSAERTRMAREIHDTLLQSLVGVALKFDVIAQGIERSPDAAKQQLHALRDDVQLYIREARQSIWDLRSPALQSSDLVNALRETCETLGGQNGSRCELQIAGTPRRAGLRTEEQILRIAREAVMNAVRHAHATRIVVNIRFAASSITLTVSDDGCGFEVGVRQAPAGGHWGLLDMRERASESGGRLSVESRPGRGTRVEAVLPLPSAALWQRAEIQ